MSVTQVAILSRAYTALVTAVRIGMPQETVGVLLGSEQALSGVKIITVEEGVTLGLTSTRSGVAPDKKEWSDLQARLSYSEGQEPGVVGWFYADPGLGIFNPRLAAAEVRDALAPRTELLLLMNPSTNEGAFYIYQDGAYVPTGGFQEVLPDKNSPNVVPWTGSIPGVEEWLGMAAQANLTPAPPQQEQLSPPNTPVAIKVRDETGTTRIAAVSAFVPAPVRGPETEHGIGELAVPVIGAHGTYERTDTHPTDVNSQAVKGLIRQARRFEEEGDTKNALQTYRQVLALEQDGGELSRIIGLTISDLEAEQTRRERELTEAATPQPTLQLIMVAGPPRHATSDPPPDALESTITAYVPAGEAQPHRPPQAAATQEDSAEGSLRQVQVESVASPIQQPALPQRARWNRPAIGAGAALLALVLLGLLALPRGGPLHATIFGADKAPVSEVLPRISDTPLPALTGVGAAPEQATQTLPPSPTGQAVAAQPTSNVGRDVTVVAGGNSIVLQSTDFKGGYTQREPYRGRSARWIYGTSEQFNTMSARFNLNISAGGPIRQPALTLTGLDSPGEEKTPIRVVLNGVTVYEGPNPLPDDSPLSLSAVGNWGSHTWPLDPSLLRQGANLLQVTNLDPANRLGAPFFVLDYASITWAKTQP